MESVFLWEDDIEFLASEPGYAPEIGRIHRTAKRRLARQWILELEKDFEELYRRSLVLLVNSDQPRPDLQKTLWFLKLGFRQNIAVLKLRIFLSAPALDDVRALSVALERLIGGRLC